MQSFPWHRPACHRGGGIVGFVPSGRIGKSAGCLIETTGVTCALTILAFFAAYAGLPLPSFLAPLWRIWPAFSSSAFSSA